MKKFIIILGLLFVVCGCGKQGEKGLIKDLSKKIDSSQGYQITGTLDIYRNEDKYTYDVESSYKKDDLFKVSLINKNNNHEQVILKNKNGIFVITPSLNKSYKFQSDWPYNNSQIYLLQPIVTDLKNDAEAKSEKKDDGYILTSKVNYTSEKDFANQKVYLDKDKNITKIEVLDKDGNIKMSFAISNINYNPKFDDNYFDENKYITNEEPKKEENTVSKIDDIVYPMYVPVDTALSGQDVVSKENGERVILTFGGESAFTVVQETLDDDKAVNYVYGDPYLILDTVGAVTDYSVSWISNGVEYSVMSDSMDVDELLTVAQSIKVKAVGK